VNHQGEVVFEHGGYRWRCKCGTQAQSVAATEALAEKGHRASPEGSRKSKHRTNGGKTVSSHKQLQRQDRFMFFIGGAFTGVAFSLILAGERITRSCL
jgi:hypothetical protein